MASSYSVGSGFVTGCCFYLLLIVFFIFVGISHLVLSFFAGVLVYRWWVLLFDVGRRNETTRRPVPTPPPLQPATSLATSIDEALQ